MRIIIPIDRRSESPLEIFKSIENLTYLSGVEWRCIFLFSGCSELHWTQAESIAATQEIRVQAIRLRYSQEKSKILAAALKGEKSQTVLIINRIQVSQLDQLVHFLDQLDREVQLVTTQRPLFDKRGYATVDLTFGCHLFNLTSSSLNSELSQFRCHKEQVKSVSLAPGLYSFLVKFHRHWSDSQSPPKTKKILSGDENELASGDHLDVQYSESEFAEKAFPQALIVDDEEIVRSIMSHHLEKAGWKVREAVDVKSGLDQLDDHLDVVFLDIHMPSEDGLTALPKFLQCGMNIQVIMLSSEMDPMVGKRALNEGAFAYFCKPFKPNAVIASANEAFDLRQEEVNQVFRKVVR